MFKYLDLNLREFYNSDSVCLIAVDVHLETLLADTDEFNDDEHQCLIPHQRSPEQKTPTGNFNFGSEVPVEGACAKAVTSSRVLPQQSHNSNSVSARTQEHDYAIPSRRSSHKGACKEVALSVELHGSFKRVDESSATASAQKNITSSHTPATHTKAQPNHYVTPSELCFNKHSPAKPGAGANGMVICSQQIKQEKHNMQVTCLKLGYLI